MTQPHSSISVPRQRPQVHGESSNSESDDDGLFEGCFLDPGSVNGIIQRLRVKKNLILQGPPGTGKTWLAKRLGSALTGSQHREHLRAVQFHANLSYEDFVRGWRPTAKGRLELTEGVFMEAARKALEIEPSPVVLVIEEINRGNPANIFGELLTLIEAGKRKPNEALALCYPGPNNDRSPVHLPPNLYLIGTMNLADRSLAIVDMALRRRFAFFELRPLLNDRWKDWVTSRCNLDERLAAEIGRRIDLLNDRITQDDQLGRHYCIGHSFVTPDAPIPTGTTRDWFRVTVETEIGPQLDEVWFDRPTVASDESERLLEGW